MQQVPDIDGPHDGSAPTDGPSSSPGPSGDGAPASGVLSRVVTHADTAHAFGSVFPEAAATPFILGVAELACHDALSAELSDGDLTVGVRAVVDHHSPTPVGWTVTAVATEIARSGRRRTFDVVVSDDGGECARVQHERAVVPASAIAERMASRAADRPS